MCVPRCFCLRLQAERKKAEAEGEKDEDDDDDVDDVSGKPLTEQFKEGTSRRGRNQSKGEETVLEAL